MRPRPVGACYRRSLIDDCADRTGPGADGADPRDAECCRCRAAAIAARSAAARADEAANNRRCDDGARCPIGPAPDRRSRRAAAGRTAVTRRYWSSHANSRARVRRRCIECWGPAACGKQRR